MARINKADLEGQFNAYTHALGRIGYPTAGIHLQWGSSTMGNAFRIYIDGRGAPGTGYAGYIGMTKSEAYESLSRMSGLLEDLAWWRETQKDNNE